MPFSEEEKQRLRDAIHEFEFRQGRTHLLFDGQPEWQEWRREKIDTGHRHRLLPEPRRIVVRKLEGRYQEDEGVIVWHDANSGDWFFDYKGREVTESTGSITQIEAVSKSCTMMHLEMQESSEQYRWGQSWRL